MTVAAFLLLMVLTDGVSSRKVCSYQDVLDHLNLTRDNGLYSLSRPVLDHTQTTLVELDVILYAILAVVEKTQTFVPFIWMLMTCTFAFDWPQRWKNHRISWNPADFCGITKVSVPQDILWKPDLCIYEMFQKDESSLNPYVTVTHDGLVASDQDVKVVSTCKMDVHKFPFDTQSCNITIGSAIYCDKEIRLIPFSNSSRVTQFSREVIRTQGEWEFLQLSVSSTNFTMQDRIWQNLVYTFTMKRRPLLYVINFLLPIVFFLTLDLASFLIADHRGEKLGFKVTVLLAISVLLLILNDILPSMSNKTPLIATYCIVIFALMLLSLLETILVTYLMDKTSQDKLQEINGYEHTREKSDEGDKRKPEESKRSRCWCVCKPHSSQSEAAPEAEEVKADTQAGACSALMLILEQLKELQETLNVHLGCRDQSSKFTLLAARINKAFFFSYLTAVSVFLLFIFSEWSS